MSLVPAKCTECGAKISVYNELKKGVCPYCKMEFITQDVIKNNITNVENQINNYYNIPNKFEEEKNQCKVLLTVLKNLDFKAVGDRALKVLDINPENELALMFYKCNFEISSYLDGGFISVTFDENEVIKYLKKNNGTIDIEVSRIFVNLLLHKSTTSPLVRELFVFIINNVEKLNISKQSKEEFYSDIYEMVTNEQQIEQIKAIAKDRRKSALASIFIAGSAGAGLATSLDMEHDIAKQLSKNLLTNREVLINVIKEKITNSEIEANKFKDKFTEEKSEDKEIKNLSSKTAFALALIGLLFSASGGFGLIFSSITCACCVSAMNSSKENKEENSKILSVWGIVVSVICIIISLCVLL